jgi:hypothetical protein
MSRGDFGVVYALGIAYRTRSAEKEDGGRPGGETG